VNAITQAAGGATVAAIAHHKGRGFSWSCHSHRERDDETEAERDPGAEQQDLEKHGGNW